MEAPLRSSRARWTTLRSSRMLPGQACCLEPLHGGRREPHRLAPGRVGAQEVLGQRQDVAAPAAQRRAGAGGRRRGGSTDPRGSCPRAPAASRSRLVAATTRTSTFDGAAGAHALDLPALQGAQQLGLQVQRQLADLVEEEGAAVGLLEGALARVGGAGEGALLVAEELALDELLGDGGAVDGDEGRARRAAEHAWRARATSSLPVPDSPRMATAAEEGATRSMSSLSCRTDASFPMMPWKDELLARPA